MNIDLTPEELAQITKLCEMAGLAEAVNGRLHHKALHCLQNFKPRADLDDDPKTAAEKWRAPL
jgi:hypothetical protein